MYSKSLSTIFENEVQVFNHIDGFNSKSMSKRVL